MATPSLAMIPTSYKATKLYSVLPTDGVGDFDVTRPSIATRVNKSGLIKEVAANVPRLDYLDGGCPSLLTENQSTNLEEWSQDASRRGMTRVTIDSNTSIAPDGGLTADGLVSSVDNNSHRLGGYYPSSLSADATFTYSAFYKKGFSRYIKLRITDDTANTGGNANRYEWLFDLELGVYVDERQRYGTSLYPHYKIEDYGDGWYRISCGFTKNGDNTRLDVSSFIMRSDNIIQESFAGDATTIDTYIWGIQLEEQSQSTSYIKTSGSVITRNADVINGAGDSSTFNSSEGTLYFEGSALAGDLTYRYISINDGTAGNVIRLGYRASSNGVIFHSDPSDLFTTSSLNLYILNNNVISAKLDYINTDITQINKIAAKWKLNDFALWVNGVEVATDNNGNTPTGLNSLNFDIANMLHFYGKTKDLRVYNTALSDAELIELTTL